VGKSDRIDALAAAKHALVGEKVSTPRRRGTLSALRALLNVRRSTIAERTRLLNQLQALNVTAPVALRERVGEGTGKQLERRLLSMRSRSSADIEERAVFGVLRDLAARSRALAADAQRYERDLVELVRSLDNTLPRRARDRADLSREAARLRPLALQARGRLRALQWNGAAACLLG
jgi:transposase